MTIQPKSDTKNKPGESESPGAASSGRPAWVNAQAGQPCHRIARTSLTMLVTSSTTLLTAEMISDFFISPPIFLGLVIDRWPKPGRSNEDPLHRRDCSGLPRDLSRAGGCHRDQVPPYRPHDRTSTASIQPTTNDNCSPAPVTSGLDGGRHPSPPVCSLHAPVGNLMTLGQSPSKQAAPGRRAPRPAIRG